MGKGKGAPDHWVAVVKPGRILFELEGLALDQAKEAMRIASYKLPLEAVINAVRRGNNDVGGRLVELSGREYMVRGRGYVKSTQDLEQLVLKAEGGTPIQVKDVAKVALGPEMRRGVADLDGQGDTVGGIVVMRHGENALNVIRRVKEKIRDLGASLPPGVELVTAQCLLCHSVDYITTQPPLSRAQWQAALTKMQQKYGAPLPVTSTNALLDYLVGRYGRTQ